MQLQRDWPMHAGGTRAEALPAVLPPNTYILTATVAIPRRIVACSCDVAVSSLFKSSRREACTASCQLPANASALGPEVRAEQEHGCQGAGRGGEGTPRVALCRASCRGGSGVGVSGRFCCSASTWGRGGGGNAVRQRRCAGTCSLARCSSCSAKDPCRCEALQLPTLPVPALAPGLRRAAATRLPPPSQDYEPFTCCLDFSHTYFSGGWALMSKQVSGRYVKNLRGGGHMHQAKGARYASCAP